jgi:3-mercaptopropionate dioxygenase
MGSGPLSVAEYAAAVTRCVDAARCVEDLVAAIAPLKRRLLANECLIPDICRDGLESVAYTRNLLYGDPDGRFSILALVWNPQRESPVHDHENWGVVGAYTSGIQVTEYSAPLADGSLQPKPTVTLAAGDVVTIVPPRLMNIHKMGNPGREPVVTVHTYGDRALACRVYNPQNGKANDVQLKYHHVL